MNKLLKFRRLLHVIYVGSNTFKKKTNTFRLVCICIILSSVQMSYANQSSLSSDNSEAATSVAPKEKTITGIVVDKGGIPVIGASIIFKGTSIGTTTDVDGKFSLTSPNDDAILKISYIGMKSQEIRFIR